LDAQYKTGKEHGHFQSWYENGNKRSEAYFTEGMKTGMETYWYDNGAKKSETLYENGQVIKEQKFTLEPASN
jgi:antitoxin component YwqK of YwqJK toxin-antitoxin module